MDKDQATAKRIVIDGEVRAERIAALKAELAELEGQNE
mgnify:CR=1 FL=1